MTAPSNGAVSGFGMLPGSSFTFTCNSGYYLVGNATVYCSHTGQWSTAAPTCAACAQGCQQCTGPSAGECEDELVGTSSRPGTSCAQILSSRQAQGQPAPSQIYTVTVLGGSRTIAVYCDMSSYGGMCASVIWSLARS